MKDFALTLLIGILAGAIDVLPMLRMKLGRASIFSAFVHYLIAPFIILNTRLFALWWLNGAVIGLLLAIPTTILVAKDDKKSAPPMVITSIVLGTLIALAGHYLL